MRPGSGGGRAGADGRQRGQHQGRARHRREGRARTDLRRTARWTRCSRPRRRFTQKRYREGLLAHADDARHDAASWRAFARTCRSTFDADALRFKGPSPERCFALFSSLGFRTLVAEFAPTAATSTRDVHASRRSLDGRGRARARSCEAAASIGIAAIAADSSAVRADVVGWAFCAASGRRASTSRWRIRASRRRPTCRRAMSSRASARAGESGDRQGRSRPEVRDDRAAAGMASRCAASCSTRWSPATWSTPRDPSHDVEGLALERANYRAVSEEPDRQRDQGHALDAVPADSLATFAGERAELPLSLAAGLEAELERNGSVACTASSRSRSIPVLAAIERAGVKWTRTRWPASPAACRRELDELLRAIFAHWPAASSTSTPRNSWATCCSSKLNLQSGEEDRQDARGLYRAGRARGAGAHARTAGARAEVAQHSEAEGHVRRCVARARESGDGPRAHDVQSGGGRDGPPEQQRSRICRTFRSARRSAARSAPRSSPSRATC